MIRLTDEAKAKYAKYVDENGRLIIDDSLPENVKKTFQYFNARGINILTLNVDDDDTDEFDEEEEELADDSLMEEDEKSDFVDNHDDNVDLADLNDLF